MNRMDTGKDDGKAEAQSLFGWRIEGEAREGLPLKVLLGFAIEGPEESMDLWLEARTT